MKKRVWLYGIVLCIAAGLIICNIAVKAFIWTAASPVWQQEYKYSVSLIKEERRAKYRHTTEKRQKLFNEADKLLTPALGMIFAIMAVGLMTRGDFFEEDRISQPEE